MHSPYQFAASLMRAIATPFVFLLLIGVLAINDTVNVIHVYQYCEIKYPSQY